ncbi:MAG: hypothetical protein KQH63_14185 [Desulfobulbaceae bacterium]|nr:hypothetical protein [Desulfobulbaceae bacterium]
MADIIEKEIEGLLINGQNKKEIWRKYKNHEEQHKALFYLNNLSNPTDRKKFLLLNLILVIFLTFITAKKLLTALSFGSVDLYLFLGLVVPTINIYVLREILKFHKTGYKFLFILSILSLVQPENHHIQELFILTVMIVLSGFLHQKMFPAKDAINANGKSA